MIKELKLKQEYLKRLLIILQECLLTESNNKHGLLIIAHDDTETLSLYSVNADESTVDAMISGARQITLLPVKAIHDTIH